MYSVGTTLKSKINLYYQFNKSNIVETKIKVCLIIFRTRINYCLMSPKTIFTLTSASEYVRSYTTFIISKKLVKAWLHGSCFTYLSFIVKCFCDANVYANLRTDTIVQDHQRRAVYGGLNTSCC